MPHLGSGVEPRKEAKNLFRLTRFGMINCFLVREDDGLTLIDTSLAGLAPGDLECGGRAAALRRSAHLDLEFQVNHYPQSSDLLTLNFQL
jgi:hypothetical protein